MANSLPKYYHQTLDNGLEVYAIPLENGTGVITTDIFYKVGSRNEILGKTGIAHMLEHMNFKSTEHLKEGEFDKIVKAHGGVNNASTGFDYTHYFIKSSTQNMKMAMELYAELMAHLKLSDEEFQKERKVVAEERRWRTDNNPIGYLYFRLFNTHYVEHSYHWTPIGFMHDIQSWNIEDLREFHARFYRPDNAILIVAGDVNPDEVFKTAGETFGKISAPKESCHCSLITTNKPHEPAPDGAKRVILHKENNTAETIAIAYSIPDFRHKDQVVLSMISEILSSGKSGRLYQELVQKRSLATQVYGYNMELRDPGVFIFMAVANPGVKAEELEKAILEQIERIKKEGVTEEELRKIRLNTKVDFIHELESSSSTATLFGSYLARGDLKPLLEYEEDLDKITPEMVKEVARKYFDNSTSTTIILRSNSK
ncbi:M16 family metallopeptidase [Nitratifractor salsuginis]|nr:pitrilysin family protein [Nitratifractor salsuginis]